MRNHKSGCLKMYCNNHSLCQKQNGYFYCLCSNQQMMPNKTMFMIATFTNPKKSNLIISNNAVSII